MQTVYADYKKVNSAGGAAVAIGNFDGVHKGHQKLLNVLRTVANDAGVPSVVYTFSEHPRNVICGEYSQKLIYPNGVKEKLLADTNVHTLFFEDFYKVRDLEPEEFVREILIHKFNATAAVIGANGRFGKNSQGTAQDLEELGKKYGFSVYIVEPAEVGGVVCSSTEVRREIEAGKFDKVEMLLGRPYTVSGVVVEDKHLGRTYGYPTANIVPNIYQPDIKRGVYATDVTLGDKTYRGITNVGTTSFDDKSKERIETHILDFNGNLYGKTIEVKFLYYMRDFKNFLSTEELKLQLDEDKKERKLGGNSK